MKIPETVETTGTLRSAEIVELRARVRGFLKTRHFDSGRVVKANDLIFTIDPREYEAEVRRAEAQLAADQARLEYAQSELKRFSALAEREVAAQQEMARAQSENASAAAQVKLAEAQLEKARLDLEFTEIRSPINGRLGIITIEPGQLVGAGEATLLAHVASEDRFYATHTIDEATLLKIRRCAEGRRPGEQGRPALIVRMGLKDQQGYPYQGEFHAGEIGLDSQTGAIQVESVFHNTDQMLLAGLFVRLQALYGETEALTVPETAMLRDQRGPYVLVVNAEDVVERRDVPATRVFERKLIVSAVTHGLSNGAASGPANGTANGAAALRGDERVIVNGLQRARPGLKVKPVESAAPAAGQTASIARP
jgi:RND family efflux transporter MFP subunit